MTRVKIGSILPGCFNALFQSKRPPSLKLCYNYSKVGERIAKYLQRIAKYLGLCEKIPHTKTQRHNCFYFASLLKRASKSLSRFM
jgi:hypothetical protein